MMTSLQKLSPHVPLNAPVVRAATGGNKTFEWTAKMENEYQFLKKTKLDQQY